MHKRGQVWAKSRVSAKIPIWVLDFYRQPKHTFTGGPGRRYRQFVAFLTLVPIVYEMLTCKCSRPLHLAHKFFYFLLWLLVYFGQLVKGIMVSFVSRERAWHSEFPYSPFTSIIKLPCKSHRRDIAIYVIFQI